MAFAAALQLLAVSAGHAGERTKPYLTADAQNPAAVAHQNEPELTQVVQLAARDAGTEQLEKLLLHSALADSSAFGLLQALQQPAKASPAATPSTTASESSGDCKEAARKKI
jgi:hypothetical protein